MYDKLGFRVGLLVSRGRNRTENDLLVDLSTKFKAPFNHRYVKSTVDLFQMVDLKQQVMLGKKLLFNPH
jgi:hypothetical protein